MLNETLAHKAHAKVIKVI